jgi:hypothetical protein
MNLPPDFQFSQVSLQDFVNCQRRFLLRHVQRLSWPALETESTLEHERFMQQGAAFHRLAQQFLLGIPPSRLASMIHDPDLQGWWDNFMPIATGLTESAGTAGWRLLPELSLSIPMRDSRLVAKFDLLAIDPDHKILIYDWKTSRNKPRRQWLETRLQTRVYPYLLVRAGASFNQGQPIEPDQIEMIYWFAAHPEQNERFSYDANAHQASEAYLNHLVDTICSLEEIDFHLTEDKKQCAFCIYRSLCNRGISAGRDPELQDEYPAEGEGDIVIDFDQIAEIEY